MQNIPHQSFAQRVNQEFKKRGLRRKTASVILILVYLVYLSWRLSTLNEAHLTISLFYYGAEVIGFILSLVVIFHSWDIHYIEPVEALKQASVDVFIPVYKEPIEIISKTLQAARKLNYPHTLWVLDDGKRDEVKDLALELGFKYLRRDENLHAKAGNLNNALQHSSAEYVCVFDADHIPQPNAIELLIGHFRDKSVAMVQTPQSYYNTDAFQYMNPKNGSGFWHDQSFFYNVALPSADVNNAATCVGTGVVYRRSAIEEIGGIPVSTLTEDLHTSLKLHKAGYRTVYYNEPVAYGLAATDLDEYYTTRHRWAHGNIDTLKQEDILTASGLTWKQRLSYLCLGLIYLEGWQQIVLLTIPSLALIFGIPPFEISIFNVLVILLFPLLTYLLLQEIGGGFNRFWTNELYAMIRWPIHIASSLALFGKKLAWKSSKKKVRRDINLELLWPQLSVMLISLVALGYAVIKLSNDFVLGPISHSVIGLIKGELSFVDVGFQTLSIVGFSFELVLVAGSWALFVVIKALLVVFKSIKSSSFSENVQSFNVDIPIELASGKLVNSVAISERYALVPRKGLEADEIGTEVLLYLPAVNISVACSVAQHNNKFWKLSFHWQDNNVDEGLINALYSPSWYQDQTMESARFITPSDWLFRLFTLVRRKVEWRSVRLESEAKQDVMRLARLKTVGGKPKSLLVFDELIAGSNVYLSDSGHGKIECIVGQEEQVASIPSTALYGRYYRRYRISSAK